MSSPTPNPAHRLRARRAFGFVLMSAVLPGSVQSFAGNRSVGRWAGRIYGAGFALLVVAALGVWLLRGPTVGFLLTPVVAATVRVVLWGLFIGWVLLLLDAWRLASPLSLERRTRLGLTVTALILSVGVGGVTAVAASGLEAAGNVGEVLRGGGEAEEHDGRYNILLLGVDSADDRIGLRPDSINVASVDAETGRTIIFGLPRNLQKVRFPLGSPLRALYRDGYVCPDNECLLNGVYTLGVEHADLYEEGVDPGLQAMKEAVGETLGLKLNYYAMIEMSGFQSLIDAMGGIRLNIAKPIPIGGGSTKISGYIEPGDDVHLDGYHALWFARSRAESSDYERMVRQKCVMSAMAKQLNPMTVATKFVDLSAAGEDLLSTDVPTGEASALAELALRAQSLPIVTVNFSPPRITPADPDFALIRETVQASIEEAEQLDAGPATAEPSPEAADTSPAAEEPAGQGAGDQAGDPELTSPPASTASTPASTASTASAVSEQSPEPEVVCSVP